MRLIATRYPVTFAIAATLLLIATYIVATVLAAAVATDLVAQQAVDALIRFAGAGLFLLWIHGSGFRQNAGIARPGAGWVWLLGLIVLAYQLVIHLLAFFGDLGFAAPEPARALAVALNGGAAGLLEELVFRGLILHGLLQAWAAARRGLMKAVMLSSVLFGATHFIRIVVGQPLPEVSLLAIDATLAGVYYAAFVLRAGSIWPAVALHAVLNAVVGARAVGLPDFRETTPAWLLIIALEVPIVLLGLYLLLGKHREECVG